MPPSLFSSTRPRVLAGLLACALLGTGLLAPSVAVGQAAADAPTLDEVDYGKWERLGGATLSPDGTWMATPVRRINDKNELRIHHTRQDSTITVDFGRDPSFSTDGRWLAYSIGMSEEKREKLRKQEKPVRQKLGLLNLATGDTTLVESVADFAFSDDGRWLAMMRYPPEEAPEGMEGANLLLRNLQTGTYTSFGNVADFAWQDEGPRLAMTIDGA
ncbi:MAG TPA: hypothetical protein VJ884_08485, partial [Salinibacter sp.]|nr:hypothetical protein [Salinibacter sp.]